MKERDILINKNIIRIEDNDVHDIRGFVYENDIANGKKYFAQIGYLYFARIRCNFS